MNAMTHPQKRHRRISCTEPEIDPSRMLEVLLALDRMVVEVSMHLYNVERQDRSKIRHSNRRLHAAVRKQLPQILKRSRTQA